MELAAVLQGWDDGAILRAFDEAIAMRNGSCAAGQHVDGAVGRGKGRELGLVHHDRNGADAVSGRCSGGGAGVG
eukprot:CAMPEP_0198441948 /NCGR_PEP_ID=MMETSP1452-20131203/64652_1 /TAXON_ID=1181717 /ORGANISM="Synchroma pusillum, Strain CCMP3072" /LENGTH=73 /DNA_ID=CAMNT_0044162577 /DNA_START=11 /DNA_END=228 /DNA_ORIENTATION=+